MAEVAFDSLVSGKPVAIEVDGVAVCLTPVSYTHLTLPTTERV